MQHDAHAFVATD